MAETLEYVVKLRGGSEAASEAGRIRKEVGELGGSMRRVNEEGKSGSLTAWSGGLKKVAGGLLAVGAGYRAWEAGKNAIEFTHELALGTNKLSSATKMSVEESSHWVAAANAMGVPSNALGMTFTRLSAAAEKQISSSGKQVTAFDKLGISSQFVAEHAHDMRGLMDEVIGRFDKLQGGPEKTALEMEVFGRGWQALNPLLREGSKGLNETLDAAGKFGVTLHKGTGTQLEDLRKAELETKFAGDGLRLAFAELAEGPLVDMLHGFSNMANAARKGDWHTFDREAQNLGERLGKITEVVLPHLAEGFGHMAPALLVALWHGFESSNLAGEGIIGFAVAKRMGLTGFVFGKVGTLAAAGFAAGFRLAWRPIAAAGSFAGGIFVGAFETSMLAAMYGWDAVKTFAGPAVVGRFAMAGRIAGAAFEIAFVAALGLLAFELGKKLGEWVHHLHFHFDLSRLLSGKSPIWVSEDPSEAQAIAKSNASLRHRAELAHPRVGSTIPGFGKVTAIHAPKAALGADVISPGLVEVGEHGPETVSLPQGASVKPLGKGSMAMPDIVVNIDGKAFLRIMQRQEGLAVAQGAI